VLGRTSTGFPGGLAIPYRFRNRRIPGNWKIRDRFGHGHVKAKNVVDPVRRTQPSWIGRGALSCRCDVNHALRASVWPIVTDASGKRPGNATIWWRFGLIDVFCVLIRHHHKFSLWNKSSYLHILYATYPRKPRAGAEFVVHFIEGEVT
jgi:hypothetical protein